MAFSQRRWVMSGEVEAAGHVNGSAVWAARHNEALREWVEGRPGKTGTCERPVLDLMFGLRSWCEDVERGGDGFGGPNVTWEIACAIRNAFNFELGRLDGATLDAWVIAQLARVGIDADTGAFV